MFRSKIYNCGLYWFVFRGRHPPSFSPIFDWVLFLRWPFFALQKRFCFAKKILLCKKDFALQKRFCFAKKILLCKKDFALQKRFCFAKKILLCKKDFALQKRFCFAKKILLCKKDFALQKRFCFAKKTPLCGEKNRGDRRDAQSDQKCKNRTSGLYKIIQTCGSVFAFFYSFFALRLALVLFCFALQAPLSFFHNQRLWSGLFYFLLIFSSGSACLGEFSGFSPSFVLYQRWRGAFLSLRPPLFSLPQSLIGGIKGWGDQRMGSVFATQKQGGGQSKKEAKPPPYPFRGVSPPIKDWGLFCKAKKRQSRKRWREGEKAGGGGALFYFARLSIFVPNQRLGGGRRKKEKAKKKAKKARFCFCIAKMQTPYLPFQGGEQESLYKQKKARKIVDFGNKPQFKTQSSHLFLK